MASPLPGELVVMRGRTRKTTVSAAVMVAATWTGSDGTRVDLLLNRRGEPIEVMTGDRWWANARGDR